MTPLDIPFGTPGRRVKYLEITILIMLWTVTIWRAPSARRSVKQRALWVAFAALTLSMTLRLPGVMHGLDERAEVNNLSTLVKHWLGMIAAGAVVDFVIAIARPESESGRRVRPRHYAAMTAMALMAALFQLVPREREVDDFFEANVGESWATAYYLVFVIYLGIAMATASWLFWGSARLANARWLRVGVRLMGIGTAVGVLYTVVRALYLVCRLFGIVGVDADDAVDTATDLLKYLAIGFILVGSSIPAFGVAWRGIRDWRRLRALQPLWRDLTAATPGIVLKTRLLRSPRLQLHRRVIEIRDACLVLAPYAPSEVREAAKTAADAAGFEPEAAGPAAEALWLRAARQAKVQGSRARLDHSMMAPGAEGVVDLDFEAEVARLLQLARAYHSTEAAAFLGALRQEAIS